MPGWKDVKFTTEEILKLNSRLSGFYRMMCGEGNSTGHFEACVENKTFGYEDMVKYAFIGIDASAAELPERLEIKNIVHMI